MAVSLVGQCNLNKVSQGSAGGLVAVYKVGLGHIRPLWGYQDPVTKIVEKLLRFRLVISYCICCFCSWHRHILSRSE